MKNYLTLKLDKQKYFLILFLLLSASLRGQELVSAKQYPQDTFRPPLDLNPALAGSFGEIRGGHFHSGLDYRTNQREGYPVYAVADGYISRLRVQIGGFGNAVYITHQNGYTSVYAHLQRFNERISQVVNSFQYRKEAFDVDFPLLPIEIPVKKGEVIAWSGNTGSSGGPHLHFEIRDSETEETVNPQLFGIDIPDGVKPTINALYMYRLNGNPFNENTVSQYFQVTGSNGNYLLNGNPVINFNSEVGFGISTSDQQLPGGNKNGVYSIELELDEQTIYCSVLERFSFDATRAVNSHIDYPGFIRFGRVIQKSFLDPGNPLTIYKDVKNRGIIKLDDNEIHTLRYIVKDLKGNTSYLTFRIRNNPGSVITPVAANKGIKLFRYDTENVFENQNLKVSIPKGNLYNDLDFQYSSSPGKSGYSQVHTLHNRLVPVHSSFSVWLKPDRPVPDRLKSKLLVADTRGVFASGTLDEKDGYVKANPRNFGSYYITLDTVPPVIRPVNISEEKSMVGERRIAFKISDNLSGINNFRALIDGSWVLMEFDSKTAMLWHTFDYRTASGKHLFQLVVTDNKQNSKSYTATFYK